MSRRHPSTVGRCERWLPIRKKLCGESGKYVVYETHILCKNCYQRFRAGKLVEFECANPTVTEKWEFHERMRRDLPGLKTSTKMPLIRELVKDLMDDLMNELALVLGLGNAYTRRRIREDRLLALGFENPNNEQRREQLAKNMALKNWPR